VTEDIAALMRRREKRENKTSEGEREIREIILQDTLKTVFFFAHPYHIKANIL
jgi:hypothetical protein